MRMLASLYEGECSFAHKVSVDFCLLLHNIEQGSPWLCLGLHLPEQLMATHIVLCAHLTRNRRW